MSAKAQDSKTAIILIIMVSFIMTAQDSITKILAQTLEPSEIMFWRFLFLFLVVIGFSVHAKKKRKVRIKTKVPYLQLVRVGVYFIESILFITATRYLSVAEIHAILAVTPLVATALSPLILHERIGIYRASAVMVGFLGVLIILRPGLVPLNIGSVLLLFCVVLYALYLLFTRKTGLIDSPETNMLWFGGFITIGAFLLNFYIGWRMPAMNIWGLILLLSFLGGVAHFLNLQAYRLAPAVILQPFTFSMFVFAVGWSYFLFNSLPDFLSFVGAGIIILSGIFTFYREAYVKKQEQQQQHQEKIETA